jgi:hypothetical protein
MYPKLALFELFNAPDEATINLFSAFTKEERARVFMHEPTIILLLGTGLVMAASGIRRWRTSRGSAARQG